MTKRYINNSVSNGTTVYSEMHLQLQIAKMPNVVQSSGKKLSSPSVCAMRSNFSLNL